MKRIGIILSMLLVSYCNGIKSLQELTLIEFRSSGYSEIDSIEVNNQIRIAYLQDYTIYRTVTFDQNSGNFASASSIYLNDTTGTKRYSYYFFENKNKEGLVFNTKHQWKKFNHDLFIKSHGLDFANYDFFKLDLGNPAEVAYRDSKNIMIEKFANKLAGKYEPDSLYRYYDQRLKAIDFSFNRSLDLKSKSKLYKVGLVYHSSSSNNRREDYFVISLVKDATEEKKILELFDEFKKRQKASISQK